MEQKKIRIFSTKHCPYCITLKAFLQKQGLVFEEIDVVANQAALEEMIEKSGQMTVPVAEIDGQIIIGFDRVKISELLGIKE
ncbi:MAG: glutaredoxin domain-containing protein [bacterium]